MENLSFGEVSHDLLDDGAPWEFAEGTYRVGDQSEWHVYIFSPRAIEQPTWKLATWETGTKGDLLLCSNGGRSSRLPRSKRRVIRRRGRKHLEKSERPGLYGPAITAVITRRW